MAYCDLENLTDKIEESELLRLCDDAGVGDLNNVDVAAVWGDAIEAADGTIDAYCSVMPSPAPRIIQDISVDISIYELYSRRADSCPEIRKDRYEAAIKFLEGVASGKNKLEISTISGTVNITSSDRVFSRSAFDA